MQRPGDVEGAVELFLRERRGGRALTAQGFAARFPELGAGLVAALETAELLEDAQRDRRAERELQRSQSIGPYRIVRELGRGGMGVVFEAIEEPLGRRVALKLLSPELWASSAARARLRREAELAARLDHPAICAVYRASVEDEHPWIAMRYVEGESLARAIARAKGAGARSLGLAGPDASARAQALATAACSARIARALEVAHAAGVLHRDVKPGNVMVTPRGEPVLLDFGLAREEEGDTPSLTRTGETTGTPAYFAPELIAGEIPRPDARCDVYALGVTLYECLALQPPFRAPTRVALYRAILAGEARNVRSLAPDVPRDLAVVVHTALERDRARRYAEASDLASDLESAVAGRPIRARPVGTLGRLARWTRREPRQAFFASLALATALALAIAGGVLWASRDEVRAAERTARAEELERALAAGYQALTAPDADAADRWFARALDLEPANPEAHAGRVLASLDRLRKDEALARLASAPKTRPFEGLRSLASGEPPPPPDPAWLEQASALDLFIDGQRLQLESKRGQLAQRKTLSQMALARLTEAALRSPRARSFYWVQRAYAAETAGDEAAARSAAASLQCLWPGSTRELMWAGRMLLPYDAPGAKALLERAIELDPEYPHAYQLLAIACFRLGEFEAAVSACGKSLRRQPTDVHGYNVMGEAYKKLDCFDEARAAFLDAIAWKPRQIEPWLNLGQLEYGARNWAACEQAMRIALSIDGSNPHAHAFRGSSLKFLGELPDALREHEFAIALAPREPEVWAGYCELLLMQEENEVALAAADAGLELAPGSAVLREYREHALHRLESER